MDRTALAAARASLPKPKPAVGKRGPGRPRKEAAADEPVARDAFGNAAPTTRNRPIQRKEMRPGQAIGLDGEIVTRNPSIGEFYNDWDIPPEFVPEGHVVQWVRTSCHGKPDPSNVNRHYEGGWRPCGRKHFAPLFRDIPPGVDVVEREGQMLCTRPASLNDEALAENHRAAIELRQMQSDQFGKRQLPDGFADGRISANGKFNAARKVNRERPVPTPSNLRPQYAYDQPGADA